MPKTPKTTFPIVEKWLINTPNEKPIRYAYLTILHFPTQVRTCSGFEGLKVTTLFSALIKGSPSDSFINFTHIVP